MRTTKQFVLLKLLQQKGNWVSGDELAEELKLSRESIWKAINTLKRKGNQIESRKNLGYKYVGNNSLDEDTINFYSGMKFEDKIFVFDEVTSTQELAKQYLSSHEVKQPLIFVSNNQTEGHGRRGRNFYSPSDTGLYFSIILPNPSHDILKIGLLTTSTAVAVVKVLEQFYKDKNFQLKWVNDIYLGTYKVGGIITEAALDLESSSAGNFIMGIGLNLSTKDFPADLSEKAQGINPEFKIDRNQLLAEMAKEVINNFANYRQPDLIDEYRKRSLLFGKNVTLKLGTKAVNGQVEGISDDGSLILKAKSGELQTFKSGEVVKVDW
ncbi:biotin--[acetyl-CoA-carboxylase] ligase [Lactococcus lactis subsp. lactis]|uniref:biotin--[acetyl-CoA-carboxylase] ligase n=1 Tax=Lactococcus lactis TaxID=1358 RepID=UPI00071CB5D0|nr:biotin--[acetyl-CoA-carboxylase] ligase [Lactococcus lactis]MDT3324597.1 biotin--[acetyl-CoA-carboxylase] ligase [Bacillota bacterium]KST79575.1 Biotin operon repressor / Biotin-protein ligase [Lactococcus lactis subsp. lactis]MBR8679588.1 biotin--[acetyl-CoA-carboxylase] ligase [Lactococcus lactis subsp. lactis]MBR8681948.1 biotin--[acetyl-CoA-carboxylase] ligase [Lactococcus lactis subsp. lactis]MBR8687072.1 biotin--[acetyl-CoA-carboxylase] ligase [Lactococcus lactis subsp. lactis]